MTVAVIGVLSSFALGVVPASAEPSEPHPNPFGGLGCDCTTVPSGKRPGLTTEFDRGIGSGLAASRVNQGQQH
ncbi:hypothetical protein H0P51_14890 [Mycobacterium vicinigordonae]|uniref:Secreted protein n=2 Tax=Mycobacterium vicinigordonae TaxID=1719132 RepID=A0A7D6IJ82_9MYCO|nr:hypothetical protein H0P51_14890 [Mycobacterium vicinigordonae]